MDFMALKMLAKECDHAIPRISIYIQSLPSLNDYIAYMYLGPNSLKSPHHVGSRTAKMHSYEQDLRHFTLRAL